MTHSLLCWNLMVCFPQSTTISPKVASHDMPKTTSMPSKSNSKVSTNNLIPSNSISTCLHSPLATTL
ncbi:hypothetical protein PHAVU_002G322604 [Phaseolus vulgaris]|uniref:Uncharacterized protein n=1 Tax=Phaseolus vulgaris TaxID=3885 RepID=V7BVW6_PHAVU|nr:hypothetical protein PHAVU_005G048100g [Phaseolus vulgaris]ESW21173.1 hypothetical protein PHAVU_005G048100g [Phaseolus vulgaris]